MQNQGYIWMNGRLVPWEEAQVHVGAHSLHYGTGVFDGIRCYHTDSGPAIFRLSDHIAHFCQSAADFGMHLPFTPDELERAAVGVVEANSYTDCYIRPIAFYGAGTLAIAAQDCPVQVAVLCWVWDTYLGQEGLRRGVRVTVSSWRKFESDMLRPRTKGTGQYLNSALAVRDALSRGFNEALLLDSQGHVVGGSGQNLFLVERGVVRTNDESSPIHPGITRDSVIQLAKALGYPVELGPLTVEQLLRADEAFFAGTACEVTPIREVDGQLIGQIQPGPITHRLQHSYFEAVHGRDPEFRHWLRIVHPHATHAALKFF